MRPVIRKGLITLASLLLLLAAYSGVVDEYGRSYTDQGFKRALITFAIARGLNGVISVAQGTEVAVQPAGVGINFAPGQILDPVNDLIERFSWVMLASSTSLGLQKMLLTIFASPVVTGLIALILLLYIASLWLPALGQSRFRPFLLRAGLLLLVIRFIIPLIAVSSEVLFKYFLEEQYQSSTQTIERTAEEIGRINANTERSAQSLDGESLLDKAKRLYESTTSSLDVNRYIERYKAAASDASEHAINLIVIFVLQTIIFPLLMLWGGLHLARRILSLKQLF